MVNVTERCITQPVAEWSEIFVERYPIDIEGWLSFDFMKVPYHSNRDNNELRGKSHMMDFQHLKSNRAHFTLQFDGSLRERQKYRNARPPNRFFCG